LSLLFENAQILNFSFSFQLILATLYGITFIVSLFSKYINRYLFKITFILVSISAISVSFILFQNNFSVVSYLLFLIVMICVIFIINSLFKFVLFFNSFSVFFFAVLFFSDDYLVSIETVFTTYLILFGVSFFITIYRLNVINKVKIKDK